MPLRGGVTRPWPSTDEIDHVTGTTTTGHEWDGIKELNKPLPRWWVYDVLRSPSSGRSATGRLSGLAAAVELHHRACSATRRAREVAVELAKLAKIRGDKMVDSSAPRRSAEIEKDPALLALRARRRQAAFGDNCAPCHGSGGAGRQGLSQPQRRRLAVGRHARPDHADHPVRRRVRAMRRRTTAPMPPSARTGMLKTDADRHASPTTCWSLSGLPTSHGLRRAGGREDLRRQCAPATATTARATRSSARPT